MTPNAGTMPPETGAQAAPAVYALTAAGARLGSLLARELHASLHLPRRLADQEPGAQAFDSLTALVAQQFHSRPAHVFIAAAGVAVRAIAPHLQGKDVDPAVLVLDQQGSHVVSLLSGHLGGANRLAHQVAAITGGQAVITTATDTAGVPAVDLLAADAGLALADIGRIKQVNAALAAGEAVRLWDPEGWLQRAPAVCFPPASSPLEAEVVVDWRLPDPQSGALWLHPPCLCLGVGCRRGVAAEVLLQRIRELLRELGAAPASLAALGSVAAKADEQGLLQAAKRLGLPLKFFAAGDLDAVAVPNPSARAAREVGTASVSEAAALLLAPGGELLAEKRQLETVTLALARRRHP